MKSYNQFVIEAYTTRQELIEAGVMARGLGRVVRRSAIRLGGKTAARLVPGLQQAFGAYQAYDAARRGDWTGAALGAASMVPGPVGWAAIGADVARGLKEPEGPVAKAQPSPASTTPAPSSTATAPSSTAPAPSSTSSTVLAKKAGVEGDLDKATGKWTARKWEDKARERYQKLRGDTEVEKDKIKLSQNQAAMQAAAAELSANPLGKQTQVSPMQPIQTAGQQYGNIAFPRKRIVTSKISA